MIRTLSVLLALVTVPVSVQAQDDVEVSTLAREDYLLVSLELPGAYSADVQEAVESGLETTFSFDVELRRAVAYWPVPQPLPFGCTKRGTVSSATTS